MYLGVIGTYAPQAQRATYSEMRAATKSSYSGFTKILPPMSTKITSTATAAITSTKITTIATTTIRKTMKVVEKSGRQMEENKLGGKKKDYIEQMKE